MYKTELIQKLKENGIHSKTHFHTEAFSRNIGLLTPAELLKLSESTVAIPGMGGVGGVHLMTMIRTGIGRFHLADFDTFEIANFNRQFGATVPALGRSKLETMTEQALSVNPYAEIKAFPNGVSRDNLDEFLDGVDVVLDSLDFFAFDARRMLFNRAREKGIYVVTAGPMGFSAAMLIFSPHEGMGFDEYFNIVENMSPPEQYLAFAIGLAPRPTHFRYMDLSKVSLNRKAGPSLNIACQLCGAMAGTEAVRIILNRGNLKPVPYYFQFDPYLMKYKRGKLPMGNRNPIQKMKTWYVKNFLLKNKPAPEAAKPISPKWLAPSDQLPENIIRYLVEMGTWAPSADNCQPWKFEWDGTTLLLNKDPERTGFFYDVNQESTLITFGAVIENIRIAASHYGLEALIDYLPKGIEDDRLAAIRFRYANLDEDTLFPFLLDRRVNRYPFARRDIPPDIVSTLINPGEIDSSIKINWIDDEPRKRIMRKMVYLADRILFENRRLHGGLFKWIRRGIEPDGMGVDTLGLDFFQKAIFPLLSNWPLLNFLNKFGTSRLIGASSIQLLNSAPAYCLITAGDRAPLNYIKGGEIMQRFWIKANSLGLSLQPMAGFLFLLNHYDQNKGKYFEEKHRRMIQDISGLYDSLQKEAPSVPLFFFRMGFAKPPLLNNRRRAVAGVLLCPI